MKVGFSEIDITPNLKNRKKPLQLAGYSPRKLCTGVHDKLYARAVYLEGNENDIENHLLMIVCDILAIDGEFAEIVKKSISKAISIKQENILISATHTHHGPDYKGIFIPGGHLGIIKGFLFPRPEKEEQFILSKRLIQASKEAFNSRKSAKIGVGQSEIPENERVMINRRDIFNFNSAKYPITVIKVVSDGESKSDLIGLIVNYSCHGTVLPYQNTLLTADYVGYVIEKLKIQFPNAKFAYFNGPCGEINPLSMGLKQKMDKLGPSGVKNTDIYQQKGTFDDAKRIGETIAKHSLELLDTIECKNYENLKVIERKIAIPIKDYNYGSDIRSALIRLLFRLKLRLFRKLMNIGILKNNIFFKVSNMKLGKGFIETKIQAIEIGEIIITTAPGEYFLRLGNEVNNFAKSLFPSKIPFMIELANDSIGYLYTISAYLEGGYESAFSVIPLGGRFITMKLKQILKDLKEKGF